jgi:hypothetical protein
VPLRTRDPALPSAPPSVDWRTVAQPPLQPSMPQARSAKPQPAKSPHRIDVAKVGVPGSGEG